MIRSLPAALAAACLLALAPASSVAAQTPPAADVPAKTVPLTITVGRKVHRYQVELATTPEDQERGLMFRRTMAADHGMIFPMDPPRPASFWMKNTFIPLDIIFIGPDHRIIRIAENATPLSLDLIECNQPVAAVLELNGGAAKLAHIGPGAKVRW